MAKSLDPLNVNIRLYRQVAALLDDLENAETKVTMPQRIGALIAIGRIQIMFKGLRKEHQEPEDVGSTVKRYSRVFAKNAAGGRAHGARRSSAARAAALVTDLDRDDDDDTA